MALLYAPRFQALDASANPISGARLYTFDSVSTTTPKATYSDNALTVSYGAYVEADSSGVFPPIFGTANESYYMVLKTSAGVTVDEFPFATTLGPDSSSVFLKDLGVNGRFQVSGVAGVVQIETGNAEGDDVGGSGRIGGYNNTQGDALELDYAAITATGTLALTGAATVGGPLSVGGKTNPYPRRTLDRTTASAVSTLNIALDGDFEEWEVRLRNLKFSASGDLRALLSFDSAGSFKSGVSDYTTQALYATNAGAAATAVSTTAYGTLGKGPSSGTPASTDSGDVILRITSKAGRETHIRSEWQYFDNAGTLGVIGTYTTSTRATNYGKATHIQILQSGAATLTFEYCVYGIG